MEKTRIRVLYEEVRLLLKDTLEASGRIKKIAKRNDTHYIFVNDHIGDVIILLGYLKAFKEKNSISRLALVVHEKFRGLSEKYSDYYDELILTDSMNLYRSFLIGTTRYGIFVLNKLFPNVTIVNPADFFLLGFDYVERFSKMNLVSLIKYGCLKLDEKSDFIPMPNVYNTKRIEHNKVIFSTDSRTVIGEAKELYDLLSKYFIEIGFSVYTNTEDDSQIVEGSKKIFLRLEELGDFINGGIFIGTRCGLHDFLLYYECTLIALYFPNRYGTKLFSLSSLPCKKAEYFEIEISKDARKDFSKIKNCIL